MEKNNLDNLFKDKFKDFSETPDERVWEKIEASLEKKRKKRIIPIWWPLGGAAAAIALLFYFINPFASNQQQNVPIIVDSEESIEMNQDATSTNPKNNEEVELFKKSNENQLVDSENESTPEKIMDKVTVDDQKTIKQNKSSIVPKNQNPQNSENALATSANRKHDIEIKNNDTRKENNPHILPVKKETAVAVNSKESTIKESVKNDLNMEKTAVSNEKKESAIVENTEEQGKSIYDAIAEKEVLEEEAIADNAKSKKWTMGPSVAPVFFGSIGEGSPIHSNFASNSKSGNLNLSYGMTVTYNINDKLSVRSGVHRVDYGYDTNDIVFTSSLTTSTNQLIDNITYAQTSRNLVVESKSTNTVTDAATSLVSQPQPLEGRMVQQLGYVEVPMELNYALLDKKFGINLIGGVSSLFLVDNAVSLESDQLVTEMGEANNANDVNFSTNVGIGLNYEISQKLQLNVEPIFKYQLNTFSEAAGNFRPYSVGVYSGLSFRF